MNDSDHRHKWTVFTPPNRLICNSCQTTTDIDTLLHNTTKEVQRATKVELLVAQLYARELKKVAHEQAYAWVIKNSPSILEPVIDNRMELAL